MSTLSQKARSAVIWNMGFNLFRDLLQFGTMLVLVRLLAPEAYGQFSLVVSIIGFLSIFSFTNFIAHTIQVKTDAEANYQEHFTAGAALQIGMFAVTNLVAVALRWFPKYAPVAPLVHVMSLTFLLEWPCEVRRKMLERQFDWRSLRLLHGVGLLLNAVLAMVMAVLGAGTFALLVPGMMVTLPFIYDLFVRQRWRPTWAWSWQTYKPAWDFGVTRLGSGLTVNGRQLLESGVLLAVLGFAALGVLNRSFGLAQMFCYKVATQLIYAIYPVLTRVEGGEENSQRVGGLVCALWRGPSCRRRCVSACWRGRWSKQSMAQSGSKSFLCCRGRWLGRYGGARLRLLHVAARAKATAKVSPRRSAESCRHRIVLWPALPHGVVAYLASLVCAQGVVATLLVFWLHESKAILWRGVAEALLPAATGVIVAAVGATALLRYVLAVEPDNFLRAFAWGGVFLVLYVGVLRVAFVGQLSALIHYFPARGAIFRMLVLRAST